MDKAQEGARGAPYKTVDRAATAPTQRAGNSCRENVPGGSASLANSTKCW